MTPDAQRQAVKFLVTSGWILGELAEEGLGVSKREVAQKVLSRFPGGGSEAAEFLEQTGQTRAELELELETALASTKLQEAFVRRQPTVSESEVANYYHRHEKSFYVAERRDLLITNRKSAAAVRSLKRTAGLIQRFASLSQPDSFERSTQPPNKSKPPNVDEVERQRLEDAIFGAKPHTLVGPVKGRVDYYLLEVMKVHPPFQRPLSQVSRQIKQALQAAQKKRAFTAFLADWSARWSAKTDCKPGYVVVGCRQHGAAPKVTSLEDTFAPNGGE